MSQSSRPAAAGGSNRLATQTSPYLLQHAGNPVDWYPWSEEALERARTEDRPILLSVGYSACHWCHVMEHESFENDEVAEVMNGLFVNIKVDREERPDLDRIYQLAHQMMSRRAGGWPLTAFLAPDTLAPLFIGTYFPREPRHGMPGFIDVMRRVEAHFRSNRDRLGEHADAVRQAFASIEPRPDGDSARLTPAVIQRAARDLARQYDRVHGGFGAAPKFPHPVNLEFLIRHAARPETDADAAARSLRMVRHTLHAMAAGGIYDHVGGGFCRYSVDERWMIPHFEKMLYDNALLLPILADMSSAADDPKLARVARDTAHWVIRDMQGADGGYFSSLDADSEGEEGRFYAWTIEQIREAVDDEEFQLLDAVHAFGQGANFEGRWHLYVHTPLPEAATACGLDPQAARERLDSAYDKLRAVREKRVWPGRDDKVLTSWNALMIRGMAHAGIVLGEPWMIESAERAHAFLRERLWRDGRLLATIRDGHAHLNAYLDDYAFLLQATLELLQARWRSEDLAFAVDLAECLAAHFEDRELGGFHFTSHDHEQLLHRHKPAADDAVPSGNGIAALSLLRLGHLLGEPRWLASAERTLRACAEVLVEYPAAHATLACALDEYLDPTEIIVVRATGGEAADWLKSAQRACAPCRYSIAIDAAAADLPPMLAARRPGPGTTAYLCAGHVCREPTSDFGAYRQALEAGEVHFRDAETAAT